MTRPSPPLIGLCVELPTAVFDATPTDALVVAVEEDFGALLRALGLPGTIRATVRSVGTHAPLRVRVGETSLGADPALFLRLAGGASPPTVSALAATVLETVKRSPRVLITADVAEAMAQLAAVPQSPDEVAALLAALVELSIPPVDPQEVARVVDTPGASLVATEDLIARWRRTEACLLLEPDHAQQHFGNLGEAGLLVTDELLPESVPPQFALMGDGLFWDMGIRVPPIRLLPDPELSPGTFRVRIGHLPGAPFVGLEAGRILAAETPERLQLLGIEGTPATNPANGALHAIVSADHAVQLSAEGVYTWDAVGYMVLAAAAELRRRASCLIDIDAVEYELALLRRERPSLVRATMERTTVHHLARVFRELLRDRVSLLHLRTILERLCEYEYVIADSSRIIIDDRLLIDARLADRDHERPTDHANSIRIALRDYLGYQQARGASTMMVILLDHESVEETILAIMAEGIGGLSEELEEIREALRAELSDPEPGVIRPAILTVSPVAEFLRDLLRPEFPDLMVLAYQELSPSSIIQPVGRVAV